MNKLLTFKNLIRVGLALVFLANSLTAFFFPNEFVELLEKSFLANLVPVSLGALVILIGLNDALVAALLLLSVKTRWVAIWAVLWIIGVMIVRASAPLEILEEAGFLFMALALAANSSGKEQNNGNEQG